MIRLRTHSGSVYEVDTERRRIRRLSGPLRATSRQGRDGEWRSYVQLGLTTMGRGLAIIWRWDGDVARMTTTSPIVAIDSNASEERYAG